MENLCLVCGKKMKKKAVASEPKQLNLCEKCETKVMINAPEEDDDECSDPQMEWGTAS